MDTLTLLKRVRRIALQSRRRTQGLFSGGYHSAFKGRGMSFSEVRPYVPGDDVRAIDWNVTARTGEPHIKLYEEERELTVMLLVDVSSSSFFGTRNQIRRDQLAELCAILAFSAIGNNDQVGLLLFADNIQLYIPPKKGRTQAMRVLRELLHAEPTGKSTDLTAALSFVNNTLKNKSICFILSDFQAPDFEKPLRTLARRHDTIGLHTWDTAERTLPDVGLLPIRDPETGSTQLIDTTNPDFRVRYTRRFDEWRQSMATRFRQAGADWLSIHVQEDYTLALLRFFQSR